MKFRVERDALADAVAWTAKSLPSRPSVPVLAGVMLRVTDGQLHVSGFDYEVSSQVTVEVQADADGAALVSGRLLAEITKALPAKPVDIAAVGSHLELVCGSARFTLPTMPVEDYPTLPEMPDSAGTVDAAAFAAAVAQVADRRRPGRDAADDDRRPDGARRSHAGACSPPTATGSPCARWSGTRTTRTSACNALVPARTLNDTAKTLGPLGGEVTVALSQGGAGEGMIGFAGGTRRTTSRLLDGANYPPVRSLFPASHNAEARVAGSRPGRGGPRVALVAERTTPVLLSFSEDGLVVEAGGTEEARASEAMEATFTGEPLTIGFNPQYLIDGLAEPGRPATRCCRFVDAFKPAVISPAGEDGEIHAGYRYLIMPIRVTR